MSARSKSLLQEREKIWARPQRLDVSLDDQYPLLPTDCSFLKSVRILPR